MSMSPQEYPVFTYFETLVLFSPFIHSWFTHICTQYVVLKLKKVADISSSSAAKLVTNRFQASALDKEHNDMLGSFIRHGVTKRQCELPDRCWVGHHGNGRPGDLAVPLHHPGSIREAPGRNRRGDRQRQDFRPDQERRGQGNGLPPGEHATLLKREGGGWFVYVYIHPADYNRRL